MLKKTILVAIVTSLCLWSVPSLARWTQWYDLASRSDMQELNALLKRSTNRFVYRRVECKEENGTIMMRIDHRSTREGGFFQLKADFWSRLEKEVEQQKRRGVIIVSRSDVETSRGLFTCLVWRQEGWG